MKKGFTLVEIMIVVAIIGLLAAIAIPSFLRARQRSQQNACINNLRQIEAAKDQYAVEFGMTNDQIVAASELLAMGRLVGRESFIRQFPLCPASTTIEYNAGNSVNDYTVNAIGVDSACRIQPVHATFQHAIP